MRKREVARILDLFEKISLKPEPDSAAIIREIMLGFKDVMNPDVAPAYQGPDIYNQEPESEKSEKDPAWELDPIFPDSYLEAQEREAMEGS